mgnify:FL=1
MTNKDENTFLNNFYKWLFNEEERSPIGFIPMLFIIIIVSTVVCLFLLSIGRAIMWI